MKKNILIKTVYISVSVILIIVLTTYCKKEEKIVTAPVLSAITMEALAENYAKTKCKITSDGGGDIIECGVCWGLKENPTILDSKTNDGKETGTYISTITGLTAGTTYYARGYATNPAGTSYSAGITFSTKAVLPVITTSPVISISGTSAAGGGNITYDGGGGITARGVCWGPSANPTISGLKTNDGTGTGSFTSNITGLTPGVIYHVRSYATNSLGTSYGSDITFSTLAILPTITTSPVTQITSLSAVGGGDVTSDGGSPVTARGICWSTSANPTTDDFKTTAGTGTGGFTADITGLTAGTSYHVRSYSTNNIGTSYGSDISFTTLVVIPTVTTSTISAITSSSARGGGNIISDGGSLVTHRGVCWNTTGNPTVVDSKSDDGQGTGLFISSITELLEETLYYVRSYAINSAGVNYGDEISFTTISEAISYSNGNDAYWNERTNGFRPVRIGNGDLVFRYDATNGQYISGNFILIPDKSGNPNGEVYDKTDFYGFGGGNKDNLKYQWDNQKNSALGSIESEFDQTKMFVSPLSSGTMTYAQAINIDNGGACTSILNSNISIDGNPQTLLYPEKNPSTGNFNLWNGEDLVYAGILKNSASSFGGNRDEYSSQQQMALTTNKSYCVSTYGQGWRLPTDLEIGHTTNSYSPALPTLIDLGYQGTSGAIFTSSRFYYPGYAFYKWYVVISNGAWNNIDQWDKTKFQVRCVYSAK